MSVSETACSRSSPDFLRVSQGTAARTTWEEGTMKADQDSLECEHRLAIEVVESGSILARRGQGNLGR